MDERAACDLLKRTFEAAGFRIDENVPFDEDGVSFELDGFDAEKRVGYEYVSEEAGDGWDVGDDVIAELARRHEAGDLFVFVIAEAAVPDAATLEAKAGQFIASLPKPKAKAAPAKKPAAPTKKPAAPAKKKPAPPKKKKS